MEKRLEDIPNSELTELELIEKVRVLGAYVEAYTEQLRNAEKDLFYRQNPNLEPK